MPPTPHNKQSITVPWTLKVNGHATCEPSTSWKSLETQRSCQRLHVSRLGSNGLANQTIALSHLLTHSIISSALAIPLI